MSRQEEMAQGGGLVPAPSAISSWWFMTDAPPKSDRVVIGSVIISSQHVFCPDSPRPPRSRSPLGRPPKSDFLPP